MNEAQIHKFEAAGLGKAPFRFTRMSQNLFTVPGCPEASKPGGSCDYCGTSILYEFHIASADGMHHKVGSNCIEKVGDAGLKKQIAPEMKRIAREKATVKAAGVAKELNLVIFNRQDELAALPHPQNFVSRSTGKPLTMLDWARWMDLNCGALGKSAVLRRLKGMFP